MNNILTADQQALLEVIGANKQLTNKFYLTGGTPLAVFYLQHRYSEDLDFFSEQEVDASAISAFFETVRDRLGITKIDFQSSLNRNLFFLHGPGGILKTEFTYFPFSRIENGELKYGVAVDSLLDIAVNKLFTIYQRTAARDYIDLYCICQKYEFDICDLIAKAKIKFDWHVDPLQLGAQFMRALEAADMPRMIKEIKPEAWQNFFVNEAKKLKPEILV